MSPNVDRHRIDLDRSNSWSFGREAGLRGDLYLGHHVGADITCLVWVVQDGNDVHWILVGNIVAARQELSLPCETSDQEVAAAFAQQVRPELSAENRVLWRFPGDRLLESAPTWVDGQAWIRSIPRETLMALGLLPAAQGPPPYPPLVPSPALLGFLAKNAGPVHVTRGNLGTSLGPRADRRS
jgi:hypothetical protein